ncbi:MULTISPECIES: tRNA lysidine(34) synthetase TilS [unclassified Halorhodospira]|uniref:tRNA lysidine(34) synthetase TilS n=1 Tax=unclassified Halorhodospira TaxID=2626748 RepID=UPI001EE83C67|nr:tRNA lysidine(34) synthetase TilS [Halorhodospira sp. M39old]MCG5545013.1 tRNA lysidine(34) synthetase TilS [Halorhodospira sp. M38]
MLDPGALVARLLALAPAAAGYRVAFSGGRDSTALLHALAEGRDELPAPLGAVHIDHGLHAGSARWAEHCRAVCQRLGVALECRRVDVPSPVGQGLEAAAREARYRAFSALVAPGECLVLAHHAEDQAETFLLRALRGGGLHGLCAMPTTRPLGRGRLARPLLEVSRASLTAYLQARGADWIEDPANRDPAHDRVYLREHVLPALAARWPDAAGRLQAGVAALQADQALLDGYLDSDLAAARAADGRPAVAELLRLAPYRRQAVLRHWLVRSGHRPPPGRRLAVGMQALLESGEGAQPELRWPDGCIRRYRGRLHLLPAESLGADPDPEPCSWFGRGALSLAGGTLSARWSPRGIDGQLLAQGVTVVFRAAVLDADARRRLQRLYQRLGVPPWERSRVPVVFSGHRPIAVPGYGVAPSCRAMPGVRLLWQPPRVAGQSASS